MAKSQTKPSTNRERLSAINNSLIWAPQPGPQLQALLSKADVTLYGGAAGSGKTDLAVGIALTLHQRTLFVRREAIQLSPVVDRVAELLGTRQGYNGSEKVWRLGNRRQITFGGVPNLDDVHKYQGSARDLLVIDEAANLLEEQVRFLMGWVRSSNRGQRCRTLMCSNPPTTSEGQWIVQYFAPWLDKHHPDPAKSGELRWFASLGGKDVEVSSGEPFTHDGERITPHSRTFIPGRVTDNKFLANSGYMATLQALPEPLRSQMLHGDFTAGRGDHEWQLIPSQWVQDAMARWKPRDVKGRISSIGCDPARGGKDSTVLAVRYGHWFDELKIYENTPSGGDVAAKLLELMNNDFSIPVNLDIIGIGSSVYDHLEAFNVANLEAINGASKSEALDMTGQLTFANKRAECYWHFRELLSPETPAEVALPPDQKLLADLCAAQYKLTARGIQVESKVDIVRRLGRSPDRADACVYAANKSNSNVTVMPVKVIKYRQW